MGLYLPPVLKKLKSSNPPGGHFATGPDCRVTRSAIGRACGTGGCPIVDPRIISPACIEIADAVISTPDDHFIASPDCRVRRSPFGCVGNGGGVSNCPCWGCICRRYSKRWRWRCSSPDDHLAFSPHCRGKLPAVRCVGGARSCPAIRARVVSAAGVEKIGVNSSAPRRSFHCQSRPLCDEFGRRRVGGARSCPTIRTWTISPAGIQSVSAISPPQTIISLPDQTAV